MWIKNKNSVLRLRFEKNRHKCQTERGRSGTACDRFLIGQVQHNTEWVHWLKHFLVPKCLVGPRVALQTYCPKIPAKQATRRHSSPSSFIPSTQNSSHSRYDISEYLNSITFYALPWGQWPVNCLPRATFRCSKNTFPLQRHWKI